jgi:hypothetical protein
LTSTSFCDCSLAIDFAETQGEVVFKYELR